MLKTCRQAPHTVSVPMFKAIMEAKRLSDLWRIPHVVVVAESDRSISILTRDQFAAQMNHDQYLACVYTSYGMWAPMHRLQTGRFPVFLTREMLISAGMDLGKCEQI